MAFRFARQNSLQVGADHQPSYADIATKEVVVDTDDSDVVAVDVGDQRLEHLSPQRAGEDSDGCGSARPKHDRRSPGLGSTRIGRAARPWRPVSLGRSRIDPREEPGLGSDARLDRSGELGFERTRHPDAIFVHRYVAVALVARKRELGHQIVLVGCLNHRAAECRRKYLLPTLDDLDNTSSFLDGVFAHTGLGRILRHAERNDGHGFERRVLVVDVCERLVQDVAIVDPRTHDDLTVDLGAGVEQRGQPTQRRGTSPVPKQFFADLRIGGVDTDVDRREFLGDHSFEVGLGKAGEGRVVPIEKREPVIVVLEIQALSEVRRQLIDKAELTVVVTCPHLVEHRRLHFDPERLSNRLLDVDVQGEPVAIDDERDLVTVDERPVLEDVSRLFAAD